MLVGISMALFMPELGGLFGGPKMTSLKILSSASSTLELSSPPSPSTSPKVGHQINQLLN